MGLVQPKPFLDNFKLRKKAYGTERRRNLTKIILENGTPFPIGVELSDIDAAFTDFVTKEIDLTHDGRHLPTYRLFSNQRISEYSQTWKELDEHGNIQMNFKTVTRESNPQKGDINGGNFNVPGFRDYKMFAVNTLQENGETAVDLYTMKQPVAVNLTYKVAIVTNRYVMLNDFATAIHYLFSGLEYYICPNGHYMPMTLESVSDESEYAIDDRKYYSQSCQIKVMGYIIKKEDFKVTRLPSRIKFRILEPDKKSRVRPAPFKDPFCDIPYTPETNNIGQKNRIDCPMPNGPISPDDVKARPSADILDDYDPLEKCRVDDHLYHKGITISIHFPICYESSYTFILDTDVVLERMRIKNVSCMHVYVNGQEEFFDIDCEEADDWMDIEPPIELFEGDTIEVQLIRTDGFYESLIEFAGYDKRSILDDRVKYDEIYTELDVYAGEDEPQK